MRADTMARAMSERLRKSLVPADATLVECMRSLEDSMSQIVLVVDEGDHLIGVLTDGDIRRALLAGHALDAPASAYAVRDCFTVDVSAGRADVLELMQARQIAQVPAIDEHGRVVGLHLLQELVSTLERPNWAVVMAGGRGTRLGDLTETVPKPMLPVAGRPILERIVLHLVGTGIRRIYLSVNYLAEVIEDHFGDGRRFGCAIEYLRETEPLGTGGPLALLPRARDRPQDPLLVMNGDLVTQANLGRIIDVHERGDQQVTMGVRAYVEQVPFGCVDVNGDELVGFIEKPATSRLVNAGIYVLDASSLDVVPQPPLAITMPDVVLRIQARGGRVRVFEIDDDWIDVGRRDQLEMARRGA
jgi:dTDP-glucose pyrophosphorylase/CBS domain-containing protein